MINLTNMFDKNNPLYQDPQATYPIWDPNLSFVDYAKNCQEIIEKHRCDLTNNPDAPKIIAANSPFQLEPMLDKGMGAVLLHGLYGCPLYMRNIAQGLQQQNFLVRSHLLPGHGTVPGGLLNVQLQDWLAATNYAIQNMSRDAKKILLVGFSTGASLLLYHCLLHQPKNIAGIVLIAPPIRLYSWFGFLTGWARLIDKRWSRAQWFHIEAQTDYAKYQSFTFNSGYQVYQLTKMIRDLAAKQSLSIPLFFVATDADKTVSTPAMIQYFQKYAREKSRFLLYNSKELNDMRMMMRIPTLANGQAVSLPHLALPISPQNSHYGLQGDYHEGLNGNTQY